MALVGIRQKLGGKNMGHDQENGLCKNFPWLPWCPSTPSTPSCTPPTCAPEPCEGPSCLPDPYNSVIPEQCTRTCEPVQGEEGIVWRCSYTCYGEDINPTNANLAAVNTFLNWANTRIAELQAWGGPIVDQFLELLSHVNTDQINENLAQIAANLTEIGSAITSVGSTATGQLANIVAKLNEMGSGIINSINTVAGQLTPLASIDATAKYIAENLDVMKVIFRDMVAQLEHLDNLSGIRTALQNIEIKLPTIEQLQEMLENITIHIAPQGPVIEPCTDPLKPQCWANIWQNMLQNIVNPPAILPIPTGSRPRKINSIL